MTEKGMAAQPGKRSRQTSRYGDTMIIAFDVLLGVLTATLCVGVPCILALLKNWGVW